MVDFTIKLKDVQRRIVIPQDIWDLLGLDLGDFVKVEIKKVEKPKDAP